MATTTRKNASVKALQAHMAKAKKHSENALIEWELACNTNKERGNVPTQSEICENYDRYGENSEGCSKAVHFHNHINGNKFEYIVVKRHKKHGYIPDVCGEHEKCTGNQLIDEINCWLEFAETEYADLLCPIMRYFTSKSDKVTATSSTMLNNVVIIAQKAIKTGDAQRMCRLAERLNDEYGFIGEDAVTRYEKLENLSNMQGWRDALWNGGNSGVIFDYDKGCYKAVFIDYAL